MTDYLDFSTNGNTRRKYLQERVQMETHNLLCHSANLLLSEPKTGQNLSWGDAKEKVQLVNQMLLEIPDYRGGCLYFGQILDWIESNKGCFVQFEVCSPEKSLSSTSIVHYFKVYDITYSLWVDKYEEEYKERKKKELPCVLRAKVKKGCIYSLDWEDEWC